MDDKEFWTEPSQKAPIINGQKPDRAFHAVKYVATVLEWRVRARKWLKDFDFFKWYAENQENMIKRYGSSALHPHEVLQYFVETVVLEMLE